MYGCILKQQELVQNADDAGATEMKFLLDHTQYGTDPQQLYHPEMIKHQASMKCFLVSRVNAVFI